GGAADLRRYPAGDRAHAGAALAPAPRPGPAGAARGGRVRVVHGEPRRWLRGCAAGHAKGRRLQAGGAGGRGELAKGALLLGDRVARAQGRLTGHVIAGTVANPRRTREGPNQFTYTLELVSAQPVLHLRERDQLCLATDARFKVVVTGVRRQGD